MKRALRAWSAILGNADACVASLVEKITPGSSEIVGFGLAVFVTSSFADAMLANPQPGLNTRIVESIDAGKSVIPPYRYLQTANAAPSRRLSELAAATGYADQAHMTRDFRDITGFTPAAYFADTADRGWGEWISEGW